MTAVVSTFVGYIYGIVLQSTTMLMIVLQRLSLPRDIAGNRWLRTTPDVFQHRGRMWLEEPSLAL